MQFNVTVDKTLTVQSSLRDSTEQDPPVLKKQNKKCSIFFSFRCKSIKIKIKTKMNFIKTSKNNKNNKSK